MNEELEKKIRAIQGKGLEKTIAIFKLCLKEMPRLVQEVESKDPVLQKKAVLEARALMQTVDNEIQNACQNEGMKLAEFNAMLNNPGFFTEEEWKSVKILPKLIKKYQHLLFPPARKEKKQRHQYPKA